jgi:hypothetical protein
MKLNIWIILQGLEVTLITLFGLSNASQPTPATPAQVIDLFYAYKFLVFMFVLLGINFFFGWMAHRHSIRKAER